LFLPLLAACVATPRPEIRLPGVAAETPLPSATRFVFFGPGSARPDAAARTAVGQFVADLAAGHVGPATGVLAPSPPFTGRIAVTGHADAAEAATPAKAAALALDRARAVAALLTASGIASDRLVIAA